MTIVGLQGSNAYTSGPMVDCLSFLKSSYIFQLPHLSHTIYNQCSKCLVGELKFDFWVHVSVKSAERTNEGLRQCLTIRLERRVTSEGLNDMFPPPFLSCS